MNRYGKSGQDLKAEAWRRECAEALEALLIGVLLMVCSASPLSQPRDGTTNSELGPPISIISYNY